MSGQYNLGRCYEFGNGVGRSYEEAMKWYKLAADNGYEDAQKRLSKLQESLDAEQRRQEWLRNNGLV